MKGEELIRKLMEAAHEMELAKFADPEKGEFTYMDYLAMMKMDNVPASRHEIERLVRQGTIQIVRQGIDQNGKRCNIYTFAKKKET